MAKWLSHPARLAILLHLAKTKTCISGDIAQELPLSRTTVSQHLQELKKAGLVKGEIEGLTVCYCLDSNRIAQVSAALGGFLANILTEDTPDCYDCPPGAC